LLVHHPNPVVPGWRIPIAFYPCAAQSYLFDQTYNVAFTDPTVQAAIAQAKSVLAGAGARYYAGPTQLSSNR
jgi:hypothetical protein